MQTLFDWLALGLFAALVVLFLQRSADGESVRDMWKYAPPAIGCAAGNYAGNHEQALIALLLFSFSVAFTIFVLKPVRWNR